jgi:hypothetical protein
LKDRKGTFKAREAPERLSQTNVRAFRARA